MISVVALIASMFVVVILISVLKEKQDSIGNILLSMGLKRNKPFTPAIKWSQR